MSVLADPPQAEPALSDTVLSRSLPEADPEVAAAIAAELRRQQGTLEMIASENFAPVAVMQAQGSVLTNKYAEGYPGRRYYGGCEHVDVIEQLAIDRLKALLDRKSTRLNSSHANIAYAVFCLKKKKKITLPSRIACPHVPLAQIVTEKYRLASIQLRIHRSQPEQLLDGRIVPPACPFPEYSAV